MHLYLFISYSQQKLINALNFQVHNIHTPIWFRFFNDAKTNIEIQNKSTLTPETFLFPPLLICPSHPRHNRCAFLSGKNSLKKKLCILTIKVLFKKKKKNKRREKNKQTHCLPQLTGPLSAICLDVIEWSYGIRMTVSSLLRHPEILSVKVPLANTHCRSLKGGGIVIRLGCQGV